MAPRVGDVYWYRYDEQGKSRPVIVASREELNRGDVFLLVPLTSQKVEERRTQPWCVFFAAGEFGLQKDSVARADDAYQGLVCNLEGQLGKLSDEKMEEVISSLGYVISAMCFPA